jgi:type II secretory pathway component PulK
MILSRSHSQPRGAALMAVLWLIAILAMACMATLRVISFDMEIATAKIHGSRARQAAEMGIAIGSNPAVKRSDPLLHNQGSEGNERYDATVISEDGRFNINSLVQNDKPLLLSIFVGWGLQPDDASKVIDALSDWIDADDNESLNGAEIKDYEAEGRINQPFNRPFYHLDEARLVRGMDQIEALRPDWRNWFSVWSSGKLDLNEASAELIAAAAEVPVEQAQIIPQTVRGEDDQRDTLDDLPFSDPSAAIALLGVDPQRPDINSRFTANFADSTTRIESIGSAEGAKYKITVILKNRTNEPVLLERTEEIIP